MAKLPVPKFNLRRASAKSPTLISLVYRYRGHRLVYSTGHSIHPKDWNFKTQRPIEQTKRPELFIIKRSLDNLATLCTSIYLNHDNGDITPSIFKELINNGTTSVALYQSKGTMPFFDFITREIEEMKAANMKRGSWKMFQVHSRILREFAEQRGGQEVFTYEDVDWNLRLELIDWLTNRNVKLEYGNKTLKTLRQFLERARRKKLHTNTEYQGSGWIVSQKKAKGDIVTLTTKELDTLARMPLTGFLAKIRDILLIGSGTGQRFSDFSVYTPSNFYATSSGIPLLSLISKKTDTPTKVPLNIFPWLISVLERHNYTTPKMSMQKLNDGLKVLCKLANLNDEVLVIEQYIGRKARVTKRYAKKHELVSSHICRRSFATNLYRMGYRLSQIMPMTGHATEAQLRQYIGIDDEQNAEEIGLMVRQQRNSEVLQKRTVLRVVGK
ncbi:MAG: phage integrase SAM-like domain-containing protein [Bacteroidota bacterium]